jgi:hypothetical protein
MIPLGCFFLQGRLLWPKRLLLLEGIFPRVIGHVAVAPTSKERTNETISKEIYERSNEAAASAAIDDEEKRTTLALSRRGCRHRPN